MPLPRYSEDTTSVYPSEGNAAVILMLSVRLAAPVHAYLDARAPTNMLIRRLRAPGGQRFAFPVSVVLAVVYGLLGAWLTSIIDSDGPGWLNPVALLCAWNAINFAWVTVALTAASAGRVAARPLSVCHLLSTVSGSRPWSTLRRRAAEYHGRRRDHSDGADPGADRPPPAPASTTKAAG